MNLKTSLVKVKAKTTMNYIEEMSDQEILDYLKLNRKNMVFPAFSKEEFENLCDVIIPDEIWEDLCEFADGYLDCGTAYNCILNDFKVYCKYLIEIKIK